MGKPRTRANGGPAKPPAPAPVVVRKVAYGLADLPEKMRGEVMRRAATAEHPHGDLSRVRVLSRGRVEILP